MYIQIKTQNEFTEEIMMEILKDKFKYFNSLSIEITGPIKTLKYSSNIEGPNLDNKRVNKNG